MGQQNQVFFTIIVLTVLPPSSGQMTYPDTATSTINIWNTSITESYQSDVQICEAYQCLGREQYAEKEHSSFICNCDRECAFYRDCCWTADSNCSDRIKWNDGATTTDACTFTRNLYDNSSTSIKAGYFMVATCPLYYPSNSVKLRCQEELPLFSKQPISLGEYIHHVPVFSLKNRKNYRNGYCAICNDVEYEDMRFWLFDATSCDSSAPFSECDSDYVIFTTPPEVHGEENILRPCVISEINECPSSSQLYELCASYSAVTIFENITFRNPHCALCYNTGISFPEKVICPDYVDSKEGFDGSPTLGEAPPHLVPFDFSLFDETSMSLRNVTCALGLFYNISTGLCDFAPGSMTISLSDCQRNSSTEVTIRLKSNSPNLSIWRSTVTKDYLNEVTGRHFSTLLPDVYYSVQGDFILLKFRLQDSFLNFEEFYDAAHKIVLDVVEYNGLRMDLYDVAVDCNPSLTSASCQKTSRFGKQDIVLFTHDYITSAKVDIINRVYSDVEWYINSQGLCTDNESCQGNVTVTICNWVGERPLCPYHTLTNKSFSLVDENGTVRLLSDLNEGAVPQSDFVILTEETAFVCFVHVEEQENVIIWIIFTVFTSLSLLTLLLTFITYCTFKNLRNLPGKVTINFVVSLFFAQIILIPSSFPTINHTACHVIGILGHYLWLSTFLWISLTAYDVGRTFGMKSSRMSHVTDSTRIFAIYFIIGWVVPFMYVVICVTVQLIHIHNLEFTYFNEEENCWLSPDRANFILFGIPVILCLCFNFITFIVTVRGLHHSKMNSKKVKGQQSSHAMMKEEIFLFLKVSVLMGLSWIWAILYGFFRDVDVFLYLHSILNPLQGFFVFCIYVCNRRVLSMWKSLYRQRFSQSKTRKIRGAKSTDSSSKSNPVTSSTAI